MKDPDMLKFFQGFAGSKTQEDKDREAKEWFKTKYKGLFSNWGDYEKNKREEEKGEKR